MEHHLEASDVPQARVCQHMPLNMMIRMRRVICVSVSILKRARSTRSTRSFHPTNTQLERTSQSTWKASSFNTSRLKNRQLSSRSRSKASLSLSMRQFKHSIQNTISVSRWVKTCFSTADQQLRSTSTQSFTTSCSPCILSRTRLKMSCSMIGASRSSR